MYLIICNYNNHKNYNIKIGNNFYIYGHINPFSSTSKLRYLNTQSKYLNLSTHSIHNLIIYHPH